MAGGLIKGMVAGVVVSGLGLGGVSLVMPLPQQGLGKTASPDATPSQAVALPEASEFARTGVEAPPAAPAATPVPEETPAIPAAPAQTPVIETAPAPATEPPAKPETAETPPVIAPPPQTPAVALETPPQAEPAMPVPPPGEAAAPICPGRSCACARRERRDHLDAGWCRGAAKPRAAPGDRAGRQRGLCRGRGHEGEPPAADCAAAGSSVPPSGTPVKPFGKTEAAPAEVPHPAPEDTGPALERFAAPFVAKPGKPSVTVLLVDVGTLKGGLDPQTIAALGDWVTVVLDPAAPGVTEAAQGYRDAGLEVAMLADPLPEGATAQDLEVALAAWHQAVPQAIALVEPETPVLQGTPVC
ncbi:hypothetical protein ACTTAI_08030 [Rhodobacter capsulatus]|uniref:hypothetical protein n=1 Tax=Rhodobacter capsulatus TaxID=1061 RepID=UPI004028371B